MGLLGDIFNFVGEKLADTICGSRDYVVINGFRKAREYGTVDQLLEQYNDRQLEMAFIIAKKHYESWLIDILRCELLDRGYDYEDLCGLEEMAEGR